MNYKVVWFFFIGAVVVLASYVLSLVYVQTMPNVQPAGDVVFFTNPAHAFTIGYSKFFTLSNDEIGFVQSWRQETTSPGVLELAVGLPREFEPGTNFGEVALTVGTSTDPAAVANCVTGVGEYAVKQGMVKINGVEFAKFNFTGAGAGNFYDTTSYRAQRSNTCYAVEYTIHSMNIGNYSPDQGVREFDKTRVINLLEQAVQTFKFL
jgi:hypothetical protein